MFESDVKTLSRIYRSKFGKQTDEFLDDLVKNSECLVPVSQDRQLTSPRAKRLLRGEAALLD